MTQPGEGDTQSYAEFCRQRADEGFPTGWRCAECPVLWWSFERALGAKAHAEETHHVLMIGPAPMQVIG
jgi:hypothetical protein